MSDSRSNRRDFLTGRAAARALEQTIPEGAPASPSAEHQPDHYLITLTRRAMACDFQVWLNAGQYPQGSSAAVEALDLIDQLEQQLTVYRDFSEVSNLNRTAAQHPVTVEPRLYKLIRQCQQLWRTTQHAFDITAGPLIELWGFKRRAGRLPADDDITSTLERVGMQHVVLDDAEKTVCFTRADVSLNFGAIGKGYALDRCAEHFAQQEVADYLLHGGNSSVLARGSNGSRNEGGWSVGVRNPLKPEQYLGQIVLRDRAISTSGSGTQYFFHQGKRYGHILDPRTGWPAQGVLSATVLAPTAAEAEAYSTAFYILGPAATETLCQQRPEIACLMVCPGTGAGAITVHTFNLAGDAWQWTEPPASVATGSA